MPVMAGTPQKKPAPDGRPRCPWCESTALYRRYHDREWGVPLHRDRRWFEFLVLDGAQAGLSWRTVLEKRPGYRRAFAGFDPRKVARFDARRVETLLRDPGIVRNRLKVQSAVTNARAFLAVQREFGSFDRFIWSFTGARVVRNAWTSLKQIPPRTPLSDEVSAALKARGFRFVGSTIVYAMMQAAGIVNDHLVGCFRYREVGAAPRAKAPARVAPARVAPARVAPATVAPAPPAPAARRRATSARPASSAPRPSRRP
jgi:DNA-3-methyladenine glycosylase I